MHDFSYATMIPTSSKGIYENAITKISFWAQLVRRNGRTSIFRKISYERSILLSLRLSNLFQVLFMSVTY